MTASSVGNCPRCGASLSVVGGKSSAQVHCRACKVSYRSTSHSGSQRSEPDSDRAAVTDESEGGANRTLDRFVLKRMLGKGGFGKVFLAYDPRLERDVALKVPTFSSKDRRRVARFRSEAKTAAMLRHPNIVQTFESGESQGILYIVSQYVEGAPLSQFLANEELNVFQISTWVESIARALHYAHEHGIVHRDIKPDNILIDQSGEPQIMDFGLAKQEGRKGVTQDGAIVGTISYMSPEQARGDDDQVSAPSDQYSLGVILYEMLCGSRPYEGASHVILTKVADPQTEPTPPRSRRGAVPKDLDVICLKAMANEVGNRYRTCEDLADDLRRWRNDLPITARRSTIPERTYRFCRRNPVVSAMTATLAVAFAISLGLYIKNSQLVRDFESAYGTVQKLEKESETKRSEIDRLSSDALQLKQEKSNLEQENEVLAVAKLDAESAKTEAVEAKRKAVEDRDAVQSSLDALSQDLETESKKLDAAKTQLQLVQYQSQLQRASQNIRRRNFPRARMELENCGPELRGWEWRYLMEKCSHRIWTRQFNSDVLSYLCLNGTRGNQASKVALLTADGLEIIDAATGETVPNGTLLSSQMAPLRVAQPEFVPTPPSVRWNALKSDPENRFLSLTTKEEDDGYLVRVWDLGDLANGRIPYERRNQDVVFTDESGMIATAANGAFGALNTDTWEPVSNSAGLINLMRKYSLRYNSLGYVEFIDLARVELGNKFCQNKNYSYEKRRKLGTPGFVQLSGNRKFVLSIVDDGGERQLKRISSLRNVVKNEDNDVTIKIGEPDPTGQYILSHDGSLVAAILSGEARVFDAETGNQTAVIGPAESIDFVGGDEENASLLIINNNRVELFSLRFNESNEDVLPTRQNYQSVAFSPEYLAGLDDGYFLWVGAKTEKRDYRKLPKAAVGIEENRLVEIEFSADGKMMFGHSRTAAYFFSPDGTSEFGKLLLTEKEGHDKATVKTLRLRPGRNDFLTVDENGGVVAWVFRSGEHHPMVLAHESLEFDPQGDAVWIDEQRIVCTSARRSADAGEGPRSPVWNVESGEIESWVPLSGSVLKMDRNQGRLFAGTLAGTLNVYRLERQESGIQVISETDDATQLFGGPVKAIDVFPGSRRIAVAGDRQLKIIESLSGAELISVDSPVGEIKDVSISRDGEAVAACGSEEGIWLLNPELQQD